MNMTFEEFVTKVDSVFNSFSYKNQLRYGQCVMNELYYIWPEKYKEITATEYDCFYDNSIVALLLEKLEKEWKSV